MPFSVQRKWDSLTISTARKQQQWHDNERSQKVLLWKLLLWFKEPTKTGKRNYLNVTSAPQCCGYTQKRCFFPVLLCFNSYLMHKRLYLFSVTCRFPAMLCTVPVLAFLCMCTNDWRFSDVYTAFLQLMSWNDLCAQVTRQVLWCNLTAGSWHHDAVRAACLQVYMYIFMRYQTRLVPFLLWWNNSFVESVQRDCRLCWLKNKGTGGTILKRRQHERRR